MPGRLLCLSGRTSVLGGPDAGAGAAGDTVTREPLTAAPTVMPSNVAGNTFRAITLESQDTAELEFSKFVEALLQKPERLKEERFI